MAKISKRVLQRLARNPPSTPPIANSQKKPLPMSPNCFGDKCSSSIMGTATRPSTILSRKLMSMNTVSRMVMVQARPSADGSLIALPELRVPRPACDTIQPAGDPRPGQLKISCPGERVTRRGMVAKLHRTTFGGPHAAAPCFTRPVRCRAARQCGSGRAPGRRRAVHLAGMLVNALNALSNGNAGRL